jgi:lauroyl/myristoyl acyltransferase
LFPLSRQARLAAWILPKRHWYRFALFASRAHGKLKARTGGNGVLTEALMLDNWMRALTFSGAYPIPLQLDQIEVLKQTAPGRGILYCWTHLPLMEVPLRALCDLGQPVDLIVADPGRIVNGDEFIIPGIQARNRAIPADRRALIRVRTALKEGRSVACLADSEMFGPLSSQILRVAGMSSAFVVFTWAERQPDGTLKVMFTPAPNPLCGNDEEIRRNLEFLQTMNRKALEELGVSAADRE